MSAGPRCGVTTAAGAPCRRPAVAGGACCWHDPARKPDGRAWPLARRFRLMGLLEQGWDDQRIGRELGCSAEAANLARKRYGIRPKSKTLLTARRVAGLLGLGCAKTVVRWIEAGWLTGQRAWAHGPYRVWMVREGAVLDFLADPAHVHRWDPDRIPDTVLRGYALRQRGGERFLTHEEARDWLCRERSICVERATIGAWCDKGRLPFVRNGNRFIRLSDLETFERPPFGTGSQKHSWEPCPVCGDPDGPINRGCTTPARLRADRYGVEGLLCRRCQRRARARFERVAAVGVAA